MKIKKSISIFLAVIMLLGIIPLSAFGADWGEGDTLDGALSELKVGFASGKLDWLCLSNLGVVTQRYTYFKYKNERTGTIDEHPVYCIDPTKGGANEIVSNIGSNTDGSSTATYIRGDKVGDAVYRAILNTGFPHQMYQSLGLASNEEAYYATKLALWMYIRGNNPDKLTINPKYGDSDPAAKRVRETAIKIYEYGTTHAYNYTPSLTMSGKPSSVAKLEGQHYVQGVEIHASSYIGTSREGSGDVQLSWDSAPPTGTIVLGSNDEDITDSLVVKMGQQTGKSGYFGKVKIKYPVSGLDPVTFTPPTLKAQAIVNNDELYIAYAKVGKTRYQRYLVERDPKILLTSSFVSQLSVEPNKDTPSGSGLRIKKVQKGTNIPLEGAVFEIRDPEGKLIYSLATNEQGIIDVPVSVMGNYTVTETVPPQHHLLPESRTQSVTAKYNETAQVTFTDTPYGALRVIKRDAANGRPLEGASVQIKNIVTNTTQERHTDSSGSAYFDKLPVGAYEIAEMAAPDGYELDSGKHTVNVVPMSEGETSYTLTDKAKPGLRITKFDRQTMTPIAGVTFAVWHDGELMGEYITDNWGEIMLHDIPSGTYTAREKATVSPYVLDTTAQWIEIKAGQGYIAELVFLNLQKPGISLVKIDSETFAPLANAKFLIKSVGGAFAKEFTTDINGEINLTQLNPGAYQVQEITAPDGYLIDDAVRTIQVNAGENAQFVFTDTKKPEFELVKLDSKTGLPLAGASFRIARIKDGSHYLDRVTDTDGKIHITSLNPGVYSVSEMNAPEGYVKDETEYHVQLFPGKTSTLVVNNAQKPDLKIIKRDELTGELLSGASFTVRKADSATLKSVTTDVNGEAWVYKLDPGVYEIIETLPPAGYLPNHTPQLITLFPNRTGIAQFVNAKKPGLTILKVDSRTAKPLENAEFSVKYKDGAVIWEGLTDKNGQIQLTDLKDAWYTITEILPPPGYLIDTLPKDVLFEPGKNLQVKFDDTRKPVAVFLKTNALTGKGIPGATFKVEYETPDGGLKLLGSYKTESDGRIIIPKAEPGWYVFTETLPASGFSLSQNPVTRMHVQAGQNAYLTEFEHFYTGEKSAANEGSVNSQGSTDSALGQTPPASSGSEYLTQGEDFNWPLNSVVIKKTHAITGELLAGAAFELYRADQQVSGVPGTMIGRYTTDNSGVVVITGLEPGYYVVKEVQAPQHFMISENSQQNGFLKADGTSVLEFDFANYPYGSLLISKVDAITGKPLADARFKVTDSTGAVAGNTNGEYTSDKNGEILIENLKPGAYVVTEIEAPEHYAVDTTPQTVQVGTDGKTYKVSFENQPAGGIVIRKLDTKTKEPLEDAQFKVTDSDGSVVGTENGLFQTDASGVVKIPHLPKGSYVIEEIKAPDGYILENQTQTVAVDYGRTYTIDFYNKKMSGLQIIKTDADSKQPLKGAKFTIYHKNGEIVGTYETNGDGVIILDSLKPGWYKIAETEAPKGYWRDDTPKDVEVTANQFIRVLFENKAASGLLISKTDEKTGKPLKGVVFDVMRADGQRIAGNITDGNQPDTEANSPNKTTGINPGSLQSGALWGGSGGISGGYTTDASGRILINSLPAGEYHVVERKALPGYELDSSVHSITVTPGKLAALQLTNTKKAGLRLVKRDSVTKKPIYNAEFMIFDKDKEVVGTYYTDNNGVIDFSGILPQGRYTLRETRPAEGYYPDDVPRTVEFISGKVTEVVWENVPKLGQIQIFKKSGDNNEVNSLPAGSPLAGAVFEVYEYKTGNLADRFVSGADGKAVSKPLPLGRYTVKEVEAPQWYKLSTQPLDIELEFASQIIKAEFLNFSANTGVTIRKTGPAECMPGDMIRYDIKTVQNTSSVPLTDFYWRDTLPAGALRLSKIVTGSYNQALKYKVMITTNKGGSKVIADNLSTTQNNVIDCSNAALGLYNDEYVTSFTLVFGTVKPGFAQVEQPQIFTKVLTTLQNQYQFANKADVAGKYANEWIAGNAAVVTTIYKKPVKLPRTGW